MRLQIPTTLILLWATLLLTACGAAEPVAQPEPAAGPTGEWLPVLAASELVVGRNRLPLGVLKDGAPINDPELTLHLRLYYLEGADRETVQAETDAIYRAEGLPLGLYVAYADLDQPGDWGIEVEIPQENGNVTSTMRINVRESSAIPTRGNPAIASDTLTLADVEDIGRLTSAATPNPGFYQLSVAEALQDGRPTVLAFSTPGYCRTAVCAPNMLVLENLMQDYGDQMSFVHVEVYPYPFAESFEAQRYVPAMQEWNLRSEPWTFLIDAEGIVQARYEGGITYAELEPALARLAAGDSIIIP
jgi:hypothetical protein